MNSSRIVVASCAIAIVVPAQASSFIFFAGSLPPAGSTSSILMNSQKSTRPIGFATIDGVDHAGQWLYPGGNNSDPTTFTWFDLHPSGASASQALAAHRGRQVGNATFGGVQHAFMWKTIVAVEQVRDLHPAMATRSGANDVRITDDGIRVAGWAEVGGVRRASLWRGKAQSWMDLSPAGSTASEATGYHMGQQSGWVELGGITRASLWSGTSASWVDLGPAGATGSMALGIQNQTQMGWAEIGGVQHAGRWTGSAASWTDLHPIGADASMALDGNRKGSVVGWAEFDGVRHAARWSIGGYFQDLHEMLPDSFLWSEANGTWARGSRHHIYGSGFNSDTGMVEAIYWRLPSPGASTLLGLAGLMGLRRRR